MRLQCDLEYSHDYRQRPGWRTRSYDENAWAHHVHMYMYYTIKKPGLGISRIEIYNAHQVLFPSVCDAPLEGFVQHVAQLHGTDSSVGSHV